MESVKLKTYIAQSGQWAGVVFENGEEIARIAGCDSEEEVVDAAREQWPQVAIETNPD